MITNISSYCKYTEYSIPNDPTHALCTQLYASIYLVCFLFAQVYNEPRLHVVGLSYRVEFIKCSLPKKF